MKNRYMPGILQAEVKRELLERNSGVADLDSEPAGRGSWWVIVGPGSIRTEKGGLESTSEGGPDTQQKPEIGGMTVLVPLPHACL